MKLSLYEAFGGFVWQTNFPTIQLQLHRIRYCQLKIIKTKFKELFLKEIVKIL